MTDGRAADAEILVQDARVCNRESVDFASDSRAAVAELALDPRLPCPARHDGKLEHAAAAPLDRAQKNMV